MAEPIYRPLTKSLQVRCSQQRAFEIFVDDIGSWWPLDKHSISAGSNQKARSCHVEPVVGGRLFEVSFDGTEHHWGTVVEHAPHRRFVFDWFVGRSPAEATLVTVDFTSIGPNLTQVMLVHSRWQRLGDAATKTRAGYDSGWDIVFGKCYQQACEMNQD